MAGNGRSGSDETRDLRRPRATPAPDSARRCGARAAPIHARIVRVPPCDRRRRGVRDLRHDRVAVEVLERAPAHQHATPDDHAVDVRRLAARHEELPDVDVVDGVRRAQRAQIERRRRRRAGRARAARPTRRADDPRAAVPHQAEDLGGAQARMLRPRRGRAGGRAPSRTSASMSSSSAMPMSSRPSATPTPAATSRRSGATPAARRRFDEALWTTVAPLRASELDVGVAQPHAVGERAALAEHPGVGEPLELAPAGEGVAPGALQAALERVQVDPGAELRGGRADRLDELVARPLRRHDRELRAQQRVAGELAARGRGSSRCTPRWACDELARSPRALAADRAAARRGTASSPS